MITKEELAAELNGIEFPPHLTITKDHRRRAAEAGLVIVCGYSDDVMDIDGAISGQVYVLDGGTALLDAKGVLGTLESVEKDPDAIGEYAQRWKHASKVEAIWCRRGEYSWAYETAIPHATFTVKEGEELYCLGLVFALADLPVEVKP